jgi:predicted enzyme related to lactoylglutathione lyase
MPPKAAAAKKSIVENMGGAFIYADDAKALAEWYRDNLGIPLEYSAEYDNYYHVFANDEGNSGPAIVFSIKPAKSRLSKDKNQFMVNFKLNDFDGLVKRLKAKGVVIDRTEDYDYGRFGWIQDLEGNPIEFWQSK